VDCGYKFQQKRKTGNFRKTILKQYIWQRQTLSDLARKYDLSEKWIRTKLDENKINSVVKLNQDTELILVADTTFFSRMSGLTVFREPNLKKIVWWKQTWGEKAEIYRLGRQCLEKNGFTIRAVVLDGRIGIRGVFNGLPV